jgi:hypothetical protein
LIPGFIFPQSWEKAFLSSSNPPDADACFKTLSLIDGKLISIGLNDGLSFNQSNFYLRMSDSTGDEIWTRIYVPGTEGRDADICITPDSNILIVFGNERTDSLNREVYESTFIKTDTSGNVLLTKSYSFTFQTATSFYLKIYALPDSNIILTTAEHIVKLNNSLDTIFCHNYSVGGSSSFIDDQASSIGILSYDASIDSMVLLKYNISSDSLYEFHFDLSTYSALTSTVWLITNIVFGEDHSIYLSSINYLSFDQISFTKLDSNLNLVWKKYLSEPHLLNGGMLFDSSKIIFTGSVSYDNIHTSGYIYEFDDAGDSILFNSFFPVAGAYQEDFLINTITKNKNNYLLSGYVNADTTEQKSYLASIDPQFTFPVSIKETGIKNDFKIHIYPNPVIDKFYLYSEIENIDHLKIFSIHGELLMERTFRNNSTKYDVDVSQLTPGLYYVLIQSRQAAQSFKIVKI